MVSYMKKMIWGDPAQQAAAQGNNNEEDKDEDTSTATFKGTVTRDMIVKEGWIFKRSRYL